MHLALANRDRRTALVSGDAALVVEDRPLVGSTSSGATGSLRIRGPQRRALDNSSGEVNQMARFDAWIAVLALPVVIAAGCAQ